MKAKVSYENLSKAHVLLKTYRSEWQKLKDILKELSISATGPYYAPRSMLDTILGKEKVLLTGDEAFEQWVYSDKLADFQKFSFDRNKREFICASYKIRYFISEGKLEAFGLQRHPDKEGLLLALNQASNFVSGYGQKLFYPRVGQLETFLNSYFAVGVYEDYSEMKSDELEVVQKVIEGFPKSLEAIADCLEALNYKA
jgi:hypothetical protein